MSSPMAPDVPGAAYDEFMAGAALTSRDQRRWEPSDGPMPSLYISHGAPPLFDDPLWISELFAWSQALPKPTAVLIVSAHWEAAPMMLSASAASTPLVYDFGGFAQRYFSMQYPTPDATALAARVVASMPDTEPLHEHVSRGLDHGAWVPLKIMYPFADVPVLQLSMPTHDPERLLGIGRRLRELRDEGVLVIGSGFMTHGLPFLTADNFFTNNVPGWSSDFDHWAAEAIERRDVDMLANYKTQAPGMPYAHPTVEHYTPLFITLGAATSLDDPIATAVEGYQFGLSKRSLQVA